jgi:hypothetical protein
MSRFLKLSFGIINKSHIIKIIKEPLCINHSKYVIHLTDTEMFGTMIVGSGIVSSSKNYFEICQETQKRDYQVISDFIERVDNYKN